MKKPENFKKLFYSLAQAIKLKQKKSKLLFFDKTDKAEYPAKTPWKRVIEGALGYTRNRKTEENFIQNRKTANKIGQNRKPHTK